MLELGTSAPPFSLPNPSTDALVSLSDFSGKPVLIAFVCNHCPYVIHILDEFIAFAREYQDKGLVVVAINANDVDNYPDDSPEKMAALVREKDISYPYLFDESQEVAKMYEAACTPDFFMFDADHKLVYRGQFDASRPGSEASVTGEDMRTAADAVLQGDLPAADQVASLGCNIKWKAGNEPEY